MFSGDGFVKMSYFAVEVQAKMPYPLAPARQKALTTKDTKEHKEQGRVIW